MLSGFAANSDLLELFSGVVLSLRQLVLLRSLPMHLIELEFLSALG